MKKSSSVLRSRANFLKYIPNTLTLCNSLCGFVAIVLMCTSFGNPQEEAMHIFVIVAAMIFFAMIFDVFDGLAARLLNAASLHGIQMDSLADMVTFGVTPAVLTVMMNWCFFNWDLTAKWKLYSLALSGIYLGGAALRLATYNVHATLEKKSSDTFSGLPSPGAAAALCVVVFFVRHHASSGRILKLTALYLPIFAAVLGLLMTSKIPYIHAGKWLMSIRRNRKKLPLVVMALAILICFKIDGLAFLTGAYLLSGPVMMIFERMFSKKAAQRS